MSDESTPEVAREGIARNTAFAMGVQLTGALFTGSITLILVRVLGPSGYGIFALAVGIGALASLPSDLGISASASRFIAEHRGDHDAIAAVIRNALRLKLITSSLVTVALFVLAAPIASAYGVPDLAWPVRGVAVAVFGQSLMLLFGGAFIAQGRVSRNFRLVLSESAAEFGGTLVFMLLGMGAAGAAFGRAIGYSVGAVVGLVMMLGLLREARRSGAHVGGEWTRQIARYAGPLAIVDWSYTAITHMDGLIIGALVGTTGVGVFQAPLRLIAFLLYPGLALASGVAPRLARHKREPPNVRAFVEAIRLLIILYVAFAVVLLAWADPIVDLLFGSDYQESVPVLRALAPYVFLIGLSPLLSLGANYLGVARRRVPIALATLVVNAVLDVALIPVVGVVGAGIATSAAFVIYVAGHLLVCRRAVDLPLKPIMATALRSVLAGAALAAVLVSVGTSSLSAVGWLSGGAAGTVVFTAVLLVTRELTRADLQFARTVFGQVGRVRARP